MSYWNYRIISTLTEFGPDEVSPVFTIREVYYNESGKIQSWSLEDSSPYGENLSELRSDLSGMLMAFTKPVLEWREDENGGILIETTKTTALEEWGQALVKILKPDLVLE